MCEKLDRVIKNTLAKRQVDGNWNTIGSMMEKYYVTEGQLKFLAQDKGTIEKFRMVFTYYNEGNNDLLEDEMTRMSPGQTVLLFIYINRRLEKEHKLRENPKFPYIDNL